MFKELTYTYLYLSSNLTVNCFCDKINRIDKNSFNCDIKHAATYMLDNSNNDTKKSLNIKLSDDYLNNSLGIAYNKYKKDTVYKINSGSYKLYNKIYWVKKNENFNYSFLSYAPFFVENTEDIPYKYVIKVTFKNSNIYKTEKSKYLYIDISSSKRALYKYLYRYINQEKFINGSIHINNDSNNIDKMNNIILSGLNLQDKILQNKELNTSLLNKNPVGLLINASNLFKRNNMILHQIIPLAFSFNIYDLLNDNEKIYFKNSKVLISGYYANENNIQYKKYTLFNDNISNTNNGIFKYWLFNENTQLYNNYKNIESYDYLYNDFDIDNIKIDDSKNIIINLPDNDYKKAFLKKYNFINYSGIIKQNLVSLNNIIFDFKSLSNSIQNKNYNIDDNTIIDNKLLKMNID